MTELSASGTYQGLNGELVDTGLEDFFDSSPFGLINKTGVIKLASNSGKADTLIVSKGWPAKFFGADITLKFDKNVHVFSSSVELSYGKLFDYLGSQVGASYAVTGEYLTIVSPLGGERTFLRQTGRDDFYDFLVIEEQVPPAIAEGITINAFNIMEAVSTFEDAVTSVIRTQLKTLSDFGATPNEEKRIEYIIRDDDGSSELSGGQFHDFLSGEGGNDHVSGGGGSDILVGGAGTDILLGGSGNDEIFFDEFDASVVGGDDLDVAKFVSGASAQLTWDARSADFEAEAVLGGNGNDIFFAAGTGDEIFAGGEGDDTINLSWVPEVKSPSIVWGGGGADRVVFSMSDFGGWESVQNAGDYNPETSPSPARGFESEFDWSTGQHESLGILVVNVENLTEDNFHLVDTGLLSAQFGDGWSEFDVILLNPDAEDEVMFEMPNGQLVHVGTTASQSGHTTSLGYSGLFFGDRVVDTYQLDLGGTVVSVQAAAANRIEQLYDPDTGEASELVYYEAFTDGWNGGKVNGVSIESEPQPYPEEIDVPSDDENNTQSLEIRKAFNPIDVGILTSTDAIGNANSNWFVYGGSVSGTSFSSDGSVTLTVPEVDPDAPPVTEIEGTEFDEVHDHSTSTNTIITITLGGNDVVLTGSGDDHVFGGDGNDDLSSGDGDDAVYGGRGNDVVSGGLGLNLIDGGRGFDTLVLSGSKADYVATEDGDAVTVAHVGGLETHVVSSVETFQFSDETTQLADLIPTSNTLPDAVDDAASVESGNSVLVDVLANDTDSDADLLTILSASGAANGTAVVENNQVRYTADAGFVGSETLTYEVSDGQGGTATAAVVITVEAPAPVNSAPTVLDDTANITTGDSILIDALVNDTDGDGDILTLSSLSDATNGTAVIENGQVRYTANAGFVGDETLSYTVDDGQGATATGSITITVSAPVGPIGDQAGISGEDVFYHSTGNGSYTIQDYSSNSSVLDRLIFTDMNVADVTFSQNSGRDLVITTSAAEVVTITDHFDNLYEDVERIEFADGTVLNEQDIRDKSVSDQKASGNVKGSKFSEGYVHALGDGSYVIEDYSTTSNITDTLTFADVNAADVMFSQNSGEDLIMTLSNGETIRVVDHFNGTFEALEQIAFSDGTVLNDQDIRDKSVADQKASGTVQGSEFAETYVHTSGDGSYTILDQSYATNVLDRLVFADVTASDVSFSQNSGEDLIITLNSGDVVTVKDHFDGVYEDVELIEFSDGTVLDDEMIRVKSLEDQKASGLVRGSEHAETYQHTIGDGSYTIADQSYSASAIDRLVLSDQSVSDVLFSQNSGDDLVVTLSSGEQITITDHFNNIHEDMEEIAFSDGLVINTQVLTLAELMAASGNTADPNTVPDAQDDTAIVDEDGTVLINVLANDSDGDGDTLTIASVSAPANGTAVIEAGQVRYTPNSGFSGTETLTYVVDDGSVGGTTTASVIITVEPTPASGGGTAGNDLFVETNANDVFYMGVNMGDDQIELNSAAYQEVDQLVFAAGISTSDLYTIMGTGSVADLTIGFINSPGTMTILDYGSNSSSADKYHINEFVFSDGTVLDRNAFMLETMGTAGNDRFDGTGESDDYAFNAGQGDDIIAETSANYLENDRLIFGNGISVDDVVTTMTSGSSADLVISLSNADGSMTLDNYGSNSSSADKYHINEFVFADGTVLERNAFMLETMGTAGNDRFDGTGESDDYAFNAGQGDDIIAETSANYLENDRLIFGNGISVDDVVTTMTSGSSADLVISLSNAAGSKTLDNYGSNSSGADKYHINEFVFADGTVLDRNAFMLETMGTAGDDRYDGTGESDDYAFRASAGHDQIVETTANHQENDRLVFDAGINSTDVFSFRHDVDANGIDDLVIGQVGQTGSTSILDAFSTSSSANRYQIDEFIFTDGTSLDYDAFVLATLDQTQENGFFL